VRVKIMGLIIIRTDRDFPTFLHFYGCVERRACCASLPRTMQLLRHACHVCVHVARPVCLLRCRCQPCASMRVGGGREWRAWVEGSALIFDDR
jgi:hypothetical protein